MEIVVLKSVNYLIRFVFVIFLCFTNKAVAQIQADSLAFYYQEGDYIRGLKYADNIFKNENLEISDLVQQSSWKALFNEKLNNNIIAEGYYNKSIILIENDASYESVLLDLISRLAYLDNKIAIDYFNKLDFANAETYFRKALNLYSKMGSEYIFVVSNSLALSLQEQVNIVEAKAVIEDVLSKQKDKNNFEYMGYLYTYANILKDLNEYKSAENTLFVVLDYLKELKKQDEDLYYKCLYSLGTNSLLMEDYQKAEDFLNKALIFGKDKEDYNIILSTLADVYFHEAKFDAAEKIYNAALENYNNTTAIRDFNYYALLRSLSKIYIRNGKYLRAKEIYNQSRTYLKDVYGENTIDFAKVLTEEAILYNQMNNYIEAEENLLTSTKIIKKILGDNSQDYIGAIDNLTQFYLKSGQLPKADYYNQLGLEIVIKKYGTKHKEFLTFLSTKAFIQNELGQYKTAVELYDKCIGLAKDLYGRESGIYGTMVSNSVYPFLKNGGSYEDAEKLLLIDYNITKNKYGENNLKTADCFSRLANIYFSLKLDSKARETNLKALKIIENIIGAENSSYARICSEIGTQLMFSDDLQNAEKYFLKSYDIKLKIYGKNSIFRMINLNNLITLYSSLNKFELQNKFILEYLELIKSNLIDMNNNFSQNELLHYYKKILPNNTYLSALYFHPNQYSHINIGLYENELLLKNLSIRNQQRIKTSIQKSADVALQKNYERFIANKRQLQKLQETASAKQETEKLIAENEILEKELVRKSALFAEAKSSMSVTFNQIKNKLQANEVVIDLVAFNYYDKKWTDSIVYAAFVVKKEYVAPKFISLFEEKQLELLLSKNRSQADSTSINNQYANKELSDLFLKPLVEELKGSTTVYLSPTGLGHQINFKALPTSTTQNFGEKYKIHLLGSSAELISYETSKLNTIKNLEFYLYGAINYDKNIKYTEPIVNKEDLVTTNFNDWSVRSGIEKFGYLSGTKVEVNQIQAAAKQNGFSTTAFTEANATEESIKQLDGKATPYVLHLATHGFFFPDVKQEVPLDKDKLLKSAVFATSEDPMMRSGLLLAGANKFWGKTSVNQSSDDGILTASEISNLDLSGCQLVVMSACETGLGEIQGSEGVFGLQRAFKMAGVKNIIMSLWKVPDAQTAELFDVFYKACFAGKSIHDALQMAQSEMSKKHSPYYWAGFVLLE